MFLGGLLIVLLNPILASAGRTVGFTDTTPPQMIKVGQPNPDIACSPAYGHPNAEDCAGATIKLGVAIGASTALLDQDPTAFMEAKEFMLPVVPQRFPWAEFVQLPMAIKVGGCYAVLNIVQDIWTTPTDMSCNYDIIAATKLVLHQCVVGIGMGGMQRIGDRNRLGFAVYGKDSTLREAQMLKRWCVKVDKDGRCTPQGKLPATGPGAPASSGSSGSTTGVAETCSGWATRGSDCCQGSTFKPVSIAAPLQALMLGLQKAIVAGAAESIGWCTAVGSSVGS